ncbi:MAG: serine protease [Actinomycetia bacterium]|nr:serine protease [Actinomycetes bacterium]
MRTSSIGRSRAGAYALTAVLCLLGLIAQPAAGAGTTSRAKSGYIVVLRPGSSPASIAVAHGVPLDDTYSAALNGFATELTSAQARALRLAPSVVSVTRERTFAATHVPQVTTRAIRRVGGDASSTISGDGSGTVAANIAVLDTGIDGRSDDLNIGGGYNCFKPLHPSTKAMRDPNGHGTFVAGVAAAIDNGIDVVGIAPGASVWSIRVLNSNGNGTTRTVLCGLDWAIATRTDTDPANDITVVNMSLGGPGTDDGACGTLNHDPVHQAVCSAAAHGIVVVAGAGNDSAPLESFIPATYSEVLTATGIQDTDGQPGASGPNSLDPGCDMPIGDDVAASFSNYATSAGDLNHMLAAPATCVSSLGTDNRVAVGYGTSFATPNIAGVAALCIAHGDCAGLTPAQIIDKLVTDAAAYNTANPGYGFQGDPQHPVAGKGYGNLVRAAIY